MTYSQGGLIQATDYNTFTTTGGGLNDIWATGATDKGGDKLLLLVQPQAAQLRQHNGPHWSIT